jgi:hypothetical protein
MRSISTLQCVKKFSFSYARYHDHGQLKAPTIPIPDLSNLHSLSVEISPVSSVGSAAPLISPLVNHLLSLSKSLSAIHIDNGPLPLPVHFKPILAFDKLERSQRSSITHLSLGGWSSQVLQVVEIPSYFSNLTSLQLRSRLGYDDQSLSELFGGLITNGIRLRRLVLDTMKEPVLDYIETYSGLEVLSFDGPHWYTQPKYDNDADRFYQRILPLHHNTLFKLEIKPDFESRWCFGAYNADAIGRCKNLRHLSVRVNRHGLPYQHEQVPNVIVRIDFLLYHVVKHLR